MIYKNHFMKRLYFALFTAIVICSPFFYYFVPIGKEWTNMGQNDLRNFVIILIIYPTSRILAWITIGITNLFFPARERMGI